PKDVPGHALTWVEVDTEGALKINAQEKLRRETALDDAGRFSSRIDPVGEVGKRKFAVPQVRHSVKGYFRGQRTEVVTRVTVQDEPDVLVVSAKRPNKGRVAVQASKKAILQYAKGKAAVEFVLDCSGSMGDPDEEKKVPRDKWRWTKAVAAFETILNELPDGVLV